MMLVSLGVPSGGEGLVELLLACHARIRRFSRLALTIGARADLAPAEVKDVAAQCLRYFTEALPLHVRDEEDSLWPRLAGRSAQLDAALAQMRAQHFAHGPRVEALTEALRQVHATPEDAGARRRLAVTAATVESDFEEHLQLEETALFPFIGRELSDGEQQAAIAELRARRTLGRGLG